METLHLELFGIPQIRLGKKPLINFTTMKAQALLIYLAVTQRVYSRDELASLLWRDMPDKQAKKNLRNTLPNLRILIGSHLTITRHSVGFNRDHPYHLDVERFRSALTSPPSLTPLQTLQEATSLYRSDFLAGFYVRDAPAFEEWMLMEREHLRVIAIDGLLALADQCLTQGCYELGLEATQRVLTLESWRETAYQQRMRLLAYSGQGTAALAQYKVCCQILADELGVEPMEETTALYEQIKTGTLPLPQPLPQTVQPTESPPVAPEPPRVDWSEFPRRLPFYGRQRERDDLYQWLVEEQACLVGLFGIGGQGKTALASEVVWSLLGDRLVKPSTPPAPFACVLWRSLANAPSFVTLLKGWLRVLGDGQADDVPEHIDEQLAVLFDHLQQQRCLLILDHVERLLSHDPAMGAFRPGYDGYEQLVQQMARRVHRSSLLLISRDCPKGFDMQEGDLAGVRSLYLRGLPEDEGAQFLEACGLFCPPLVAKPLVARYDGHPLTLKLIAVTAQKPYVEDLDAFLMDETLMFEELRQVVEQQVATLLPSEKVVLSTLARQSQPVSFQTLADMIRPSDRSQLLETLRALQRRSLLETSKGTFALPNVVAAYITKYENDQEA